MPGTLRTGSRGCCTLEDGRPPRLLPAGHPFFVWDFSNVSKKTSSTTSSPNIGPQPLHALQRKIKFAALLDCALALGFDAVVTIHYARVITTEDGNRNLHRAADWVRPVLHYRKRAHHEQLKHAWFTPADTPQGTGACGGGKKRSYSVAKKPDSYICFIPEGDTRAWLGDHTMRPGLIKDTHGEVLGGAPARRRTPWKPA